MKANPKFKTPYPIIFFNHLTSLVKAIGEVVNGRRAFILTDQNTHQLCWPLIENLLDLNVYEFSIPAGEAFKQLPTIERIWEELNEQNADRYSCFINLGGGVVGDIGGFAAGTFMRGIPYIQIPTTVLSMVDASVGSKLGFNFRKMKNGIGLFADPEAVLIYSGFLKTLPNEEMLSGYAEVIKHALIADKSLWESISGSSINAINWELVIPESVKIKDEIVFQDRNEQGERKKLNFGHTIAHAIEMLMLNKNENIRHGHAVAVGIICESYISYRLNLLSDMQLSEITAYIWSQFPAVFLTKDDIAVILDLIRYDKKNKDGENRFTLLHSIGSSAFDYYVPEQLISSSLEFYLKRVDEND